MKLLLNLDRSLNTFNRLVRSIGRRTRNCEQSDARHYKLKQELILWAHLKVDDQDDVVIFTKGSFSIRVLNLGD